MLITSTRAPTQCSTRQLFRWAMSSFDCTGPAPGLPSYLVCWSDSTSMNPPWILLCHIDLLPLPWLESAPTSGPAPVPLECHRSSLGWPPHNQLWTAWPWIHFSQDSLPLVCWAGHCRAEGPQLAESSLNADTSIPSAGLCSSGVTELVPKPVMSILPVSALTQFH